MNTRILDFHKIGSKYTDVFSRRFRFDDLRIVIGTDKISDHMNGSTKSSRIQISTTSLEECINGSYNESCYENTTYGLEDHEVTKLSSDYITCTKSITKNDYEGVGNYYTYSNILKNTSYNLHYEDSNN